MLMKNYNTITQNSFVQFVLPHARLMLDCLDNPQNIKLASHPITR
jgi:hypothetical protein